MRIVPRAPAAVSLALLSCALACGNGDPPSPEKGVGASPRVVVPHSFDLDQQMATIPHLAIMFSMSWFGFPSEFGGTDNTWGTWIFAPPPTTTCLGTNNPAACGADQQHEIASKRRPLAGFYTVSGKDIESLRRTDLFLSTLRRSCDDGAKLDAWAVQLSSIVLTSAHTASPEPNAELNYRALLSFFQEAEANGIANVIIPAQDATWYWHFHPSNALANIQQDAIDMVNLSLQHSSAFKINGKPVLLYYVDSSSGSDGPTPAQWEAIFANARSTTGSDFYTIANAQGSNTAWFQAFDAIAPWIDLSAWGAAAGSTTRQRAVDYAGRITNSIFTAAAANPGRVVFGGVSPGFDDYTEHWGACEVRLIPRDTEFVGGQFDYLKSKAVKGVVLQTWDDWTEGSEWEPDTASGTAFLVSLRNNLGNLYGETPDPAGDTRLDNRWQSYGQARNCPGVPMGTSPVTLTCGTGTGAITGVVSNVQTGGAISGATVSWSGGSAVSDTAGNYTLANVPAGTVAVTGTATGYLARSYSVAVTGGATTTQAIQLSTSGKIVGNVTGNGTALSGATVSISGGQIPTSQSVTTDAAGHYDQGWVPIGSYTVTCSATGFAPLSQTASVATGATTTVNCALSPPCNEQPVITEPFDGQSVGPAINLHASAASCVTVMKVYIDDVIVQTISGNVSPVPPATANWINGYTEGVAHRLVVVGFANDAGTASTTVHFTWP